MPNIVIFENLLLQFRPNSRMYLPVTTLAKEMNKVIQSKTNPSHPSRAKWKNVLKMAQLC